VVRGNSDARLPNPFGRPSVEILHQSDLLRKPVEPKSPAGAGASEGGNQMPRMKTGAATPVSPLSNS